MKYLIAMTFLVCVSLGAAQILEWSDLNAVPDWEVPIIKNVWVKITQTMKEEIRNARREGSEESDLDLIGSFKLRQIQLETRKERVQYTLQNPKLKQKDRKDLEDLLKFLEGIIIPHKELQKAIRERIGNRKVADFHFYDNCKKPYLCYIKSGVTMPQRVVFSFDNSSLVSLRETTRNGGFSSMGNAVREDIQLLEIIQDEAEEGFTELIVRSKKKEKIIILPSIQRMLRRSKK